MNQKVTTNQLARMIANGFCEVDKKFDKKFEEINHKIDQIQIDITDMKTDIQDLQIAKNNYVYKIDHNRLVHRVKVLEDKI
ncbi:MAG: hypothetical protein ACOZAR_05105 [Patescibacteria group bacterium]